MLDYFYEQDADVFMFYRIPKELFTNPKYKDTCDSAKLLYGLLLDRNSLSRKHGWLDEKRRVYIQYAREEAMETLGCGYDKIIKLFKELNDVDLIEEVRQGQGKANIIYVGKFVTSTFPHQTSETEKKCPAGQEYQQNSEKPSSRTRKNRSE